MRLFGPFAFPDTSMLIREYTPADLDALRRMHASQGFDYAFPDLSDPIFISKLILEDDSGRPVMAALARLTCEMYLLDRTADRTALADDVALPSGACSRAFAFARTAGAQEVLPGRPPLVLADEPGDRRGICCPSDDRSRSLDLRATAPKQRAARVALRSG